MNTPLFSYHRMLGAKFVEFAGWNMPLSFKGIIEEHNAVRICCGVFDISHMGQIETSSLEAIQKLTTNDASKLEIGQGQYSFLCAQDGGIIDDLLIYHLKDKYLLVVNAINAEKVFNIISMIDGSSKLLFDFRAAIALQGPKSQEVLQKLTTFNLSSLKFRRIEAFEVAGEKCLVSRSGYTGEDGFEIFAEIKSIVNIWEALMKEKVTPCGLGARDILRIEAGLPLYGHEVDINTSPIEAGFERFVKFGKKDFHGKDILLKQLQNGIKKKLIGFEMDEKIPPRQGYRIFMGQKDIGIVTSGTFSPTLGKAIGMDT